MPNPLPTYYWDANIFLGWLRRESTLRPSQRAAIRRLLRENAERSNVIVTSTISHLEVIPKKLTIVDPLAEHKYWGFFSSPYFFDVEPSKQIIALARHIKDYYYAEGNPKTGEVYRMVSTGDAVHLATAITHNATELHTRDKSTKGGNVPLLGIEKRSPSGKIADQWPLTIVDPEESQLDIEDYVDAPHGCESCP